MEVLKFALMHPSVIVIALIALLFLYSLIYRWFDRLIDKRCEERMKAALEDQEKELQKKREQFDAYVTEENNKLNHRHRVVINSLKHGFTKASQQAAEEFSEELSVRFLRSSISNFLPDIYPNENPLRWPKDLRDRLLRAVRHNIRVKNYEINAKIIGSTGEEYDTTLTTCSCQDFEMHKPQPCKHMLYLHMQLGHAVCDGKQIEQSIRQLQQASDAAQKTKKKT